MSSVLLFIPMPKRRPPEICVAQIELMASKWRRMSYDEWGIAGGVLERLVNPTGEIFDRGRGARALNLPGFAPFKRNLIEPFANAADAIGSLGT
jgi:hypothetical protein